MNDVANLNQFNYIFSNSKLDLAGAQNGIKIFLKNNADELFRDIPDGGVGIIKMKQLFEIGGIAFNTPAQFKAALTNNSTFRNHEQALLIRINALREIDKFDKVSYFEPTEMGLFIWRDGKVYLNDKLIYDKKPNAVYFNDGYFFIVENNWKDSVYVDLNRQIETILEDIEGMDIFLDNKSVLFTKWNDDYTKSFKQKIDLNSGNIIWEVEAYFGKPFLDNGCLFASLESKLFKIDPNTGNFIWELNLSQKHKSYSINGQETPIDIQGYIGLHNDCLYVKAGNRLILGIDTSSGEETFCYEYNRENVLLDNLRLDCNKGVIFSIGSTEYFELNLSSHESEVVPVKLNVIETTRMGTWEENIIYFWEGGTSSNFGLFDRDTKEIKFVQNLNVSGYPAIKDIKHGHGKVYVLDGNNHLHIFE